MRIFNTLILSSAVIHTRNLSNQTLHHSFCSHLLHRIHYLHVLHSVHGHGTYGDNLLPLLALLNIHILLLNHHLSNHFLLQHKIHVLHTHHINHANVRLLLDMLVHSLIYIHLLKFSTLIHP